MRVHINVRKGEKREAILFDLFGFNISYGLFMRNR